MTKELPVKERIAYALEDLPNRVTIGFEVETQCDEAGGETDYDSMRMHAEENINTSDVCEAANIPYNTRWIEALGYEDDAQSLASALSVDWSDVVDSYIDNMDTDDWTSESGWDEIGADIRRQLNRRQSDWEYCEDGSVSGPEFQSPVCKGRDDAISRAEALFAALNSDGRVSIDAECSCHIHVRMENIFHTGHNILQQLLFEELFNDLDALPDCIKDRCRAEPKWIQPSDGGESTFSGKYNPIQRHSGLGTWEFRIFGNVDNVDDFTRCLDAALNAMHRAYTRFLAKDRKELPAALWVELATRAMANWEPIQNAPEYGKYWEKPADVATVTESTSLVDRDGDCNCDSCQARRHDDAIVAGRLVEDAVLADCS